VELLVDQFAYMKGSLSPKAGVRIVAHEQNSFPQTDDFGLDLQPGTASSISLQIVKRHQYSLE